MELNGLSGPEWRSGSGTPFLLIETGQQRSIHVGAESRLSALCDCSEYQAVMTGFQKVLASLP